MSQFKATRFHAWRVGLLSSFFFIAGHFLIAEPAEKTLEEAEGAYVSGNFTSALKLYDEFLSRHASHAKVAEVFYWKGRTLLAMDRFQEAQDAFRSAVKEAPDLSFKEEAQLGYADSLYYVGELEGALSEYEELLNNRSSVHRPYLLSQIGFIWKDRGNAEKSDTFLKELIQHYPDSYETQQALKVKPFHSRGVYFIQVGVFHIHSNVEKLIPKIESLAYPCQVEEIKTASGRAYKVKVGGFSESTQARKAVIEIEKVAQVRGRVVKE
jgi:tetratricopeptide (TPR) repeat protein